MKIAYCSDVHIEFGPLEVKNTENADVLVLAGDIIVGASLYDHDETHVLMDSGRNFKVQASDNFHTFFENCCKEFKDVIYIFGNHEYYHGDFATQISYVREKLARLTNLHILEKETISLDDVTFICGTMWTNFNNNDSLAKWDIEHSMNDYNIIKNSNRMMGERPAKLSADDTYEDHLAFMKFAESALNEDNKVVMVTHHGPTMQCVPEKYQGDTRMNPGYVSDLSDFILDHPKIKAWIFGHSHVRQDFMVGPTRILSNCRGYHNYEPMADSFEMKYFEV